MSKMSELFNDLKSKLPQKERLSSAEQKQQEINKSFALALADQDRRLLELAGGVSNE